jgi:hypothetical protein
VSGRGASSSPTPTATPAPRRSPVEGPSASVPRMR